MNPAVAYMMCACEGLEYGSSIEVPFALKRELVNHPLLVCINNDYWNGVLIEWV